MALWGLVSLFLSDLKNMAIVLNDKLFKLVKQFSGKSRITETNVSDMLREVRLALLEADVAFP